MTTNEKRRAGRALLRVLGAKAAAFQHMTDEHVAADERGEVTDQMTDKLLVVAVELYTAARDVVLHHEPKRREVAKT